MKQALYVLWFCATASDAIAAVLAAVYVYRLRTKLSSFIALCLAGVALEAVVAAVSLVLFWPNEFTAAPAFAITRAMGRTVKSGCVWTLVLYLLNFCSGIQKKVDKAG